MGLSMPLRLQAVTGAGQEAELLLERRTTLGVTRDLARWRGHTSAVDVWLRAEGLFHCLETVAQDEASLLATPARASALAPAAPAPF